MDPAWMSIHIDDGRPSLLAWVPCNLAHKKGKLPVASVELAGARRRTARRVGGEELSSGQNQARVYSEGPVKDRHC